MVHLAHLINPVKVPQSSELYYAQPITFESIRIAKNYAGDTVQVDLLTAQFREDHDMIPDYFTITPDLERSVIDFTDAPKPKKLPLLCDLLDRLYHGSTAPYLVYTNVDIGVQPQFYREIARRIEQGNDTFIINRRRLPDIYRTPADLPLIYADKGLPHPGFDCFVFHRDLYPLFRLGRVCIGIPFIEITLSQNLFCFARQFRLYEQDYLTFHIGLEIYKKRNRHYLKHNRTEFRKAVALLWPDLDSKKFPWGDRSFPVRMVKWGLHPCIPIRLALLLEKRRIQHLFRRLSKRYSSFIKR